MAEWVSFTPMIQPAIEILALKKGFLRAAAEPIHALVRFTEGGPIPGNTRLALYCALAIGVVVVSVAVVTSTS